MEHTFEELKKKNVSELREVAKGIEDEAVKGYTQLNKEHLLEAICKALNIDMHVHHHVEGIDKATIKKKIRELKKQRDEALAAKDKTGLKKSRKEIKKLKNELRSHLV
jgi:histidyl-tRNA synthetase